MTLCTAQTDQLVSDQEGKCVILLPFNPEQRAIFLMQCLEMVTDPHSGMQLTAVKATLKLLGGIPLLLAVVANFLSDSLWSPSVFGEQYDRSPYPWSGAIKIIRLDGLLWYGTLKNVFDSLDYALQDLSAKGREVIRILALFDGIEVVDSLISSKQKDDIPDFLRPRRVSHYVHA